MNKKRFLPILLSSVMVASTLTGCTGLVNTNFQKDMQQTVATIDISCSEDFVSGEYAKYADIIKEDKVVKRDLVAYFINQGYYLVQSQGYSYSDTFDIMLETLVNRKIVSQYAMVYFFENHSDKYSVEGYNAAIKDSEHPGIDGVKYFLDEEEIAKAEYDMRKMINDSIDSTESSLIATAEHPEHDHSVRTMPTGVDTEEEDYYDTEYRIYTGKNAASDCGSYERVDGSTVLTRKKAYNSFLSGLKNNYLLSDGEQSLEFESLEYWYTELEGQLESALIEKLGDEIEDNAEKALTEEFVTERYEEIFSTQKQSYDASASSFETDIDSVSDSKFVLYAPTKGYGFVYNILLPFSTSQSYKLSTYSNDSGLSEGEFYEKRAALLNDIKATDQRGSWFRGEEDYSFKASENNVTAYGASDYLFFENSVLDNERYEKLENYYGRYSYNGKVEYDEDETDYNGYTLTPNEITVDEFIGEMEGYLQFAGLNASGSHLTTYATKANEFTDAEGDIDYSKFMYYVGNVEVNFNANTVKESNSDAYKATSVISELSFAYNTDTAGLNTYLGYSISAYDTSFVKEFEYAGKYAVEQGVGTYVVCPSDYGWHILYCSFVFGEGEVYTFNWDEIEVEGTFSYYFYEALKSSTSGNTTKVYETQIVNKYNIDDCVETFKDRYQDYADLDNQA